MTTQAIQTEVGEIPNPANWLDNSDEPSVLDLGDPSILFLEKSLDGKVSRKDISPALDEYKRLHKAGIASPAELLTLSRAYPENGIYTKALAKMDIADDDKLVIGGPASIELVDREGHLITTNALSKAFDKYMDNFRTRNAMVLHSDVQVGWALPAYISKSGQIFKSGVNGNGLFFITELRNDTKISKKVAEQIHSGKLKSYSIAGSAIKTQNIQKGLQDVMQVDELELAEVTVCEKGVNQGASFDIIKADNAATSTCIDGSCLVKDEEDEEENKKFQKSEVSYQKATEGQLKHGFSCGTCDFFVKEDGSCSIVEGSIDADDWCTRHSGNTHEGPSDDEPVQKQEVNLIMTKDGEIDFTKSFLDYVKKEMPQDGIEAFPILYNTQARQEEHHRLLDKYGFPSELEPEYARNTPVSEEDPTGHRYVPWAVNAAGDSIGMRHYDEALTVPQVGKYQKRGVVEGGNSNETPVSEMNTTEGFNNLLSAITAEKIKASGTQDSGEIEIKISKADDFFNWMAQDQKHLYKESCPCEFCFQKSSDYKGTVEKPTNFLD